MSGGTPRKGIAHVVAVNMGYGHERPAHSMRQFAVGGKVTIANDYQGIPKLDRRLWEGGRKWYERVSRFKKVPVVGPAVFWVMDEMQEIPEFYPRRDLSRPNLQLLQFYALIRKRGFMRHLVETLAKNPKPLLCTFMTPAFAAEEYGYPGEIFVLATDSDISRTWAPLHPKRSRIRYFAPTGRVKERLMLYGVKEDNIELTGFPLPMNAVGGAKPKAALQDLSRRLHHLDPRSIFISRTKDTIKAHLGQAFYHSVEHKKSKPIHIAFMVGGAGAQRELAIEATKSLRSEIRSGRIKMTLVAGTRPEVSRYFVTEVKKMSLSGALKKGNIDVMYEQDRKKYFTMFERAVRTFDIIWTKPSEMSFYTGLGIPIIMAPPIGSQEDFNRDWLMQVGGGIDQLDPKYANEWLFDWINSGALARMAWNGFIEAPTHGAYRMGDILMGRPNTIHELPLVV